MAYVAKKDQVEDIFVAHAWVCSIFLRCTLLQYLVLLLCRSLCSYRIQPGSILIGCLIEDGGDIQLPLEVAALALLAKEGSVRAVDILKTKLKQLPPHVVASILRLLVRTSADKDGLHALANKPELHNIIARAMEKHIASPEVQKAACSAISNITRENSVLRTNFANSYSHSIILRFMRQRIQSTLTDPNLHTEAIYALVALMKDHNHLKEQLIRDKALSTILDSRKLFRSSEAAQEAALHCLKTLATCKEAQQELAQVEKTNMILDAIREHRMSVEVLRHAFHLLQLVTVSNEICPELLDLIVQVSADHLEMFDDKNCPRFSYWWHRSENRADVLCKVFVALSKLLEKDPEKTHEIYPRHVEEVFRVVLMAMQRQSLGIDLQAEACYVLKTLSKDSKNHAFLGSEEVVSVLLESTMDARQQSDRKKELDVMLEVFEVFGLLAEKLDPADPASPLGSRRIELRDCITHFQLINKDSKREIPPVILRFWNRLDAA